MNLPAAGWLALLLLVVGRPVAADDETCMDCHEDADLESANGRKVGVDAKELAASAHRTVPCGDCHDQPGDYDDAPHFDRYRRVNCNKCHAAAQSSFAGSFHGIAAARGDPQAPRCRSCHQAGGSHAIAPLSPRTSEAACQRCHAKEAAAYDGSVHQAAARLGKPSPGCTSCHATHSAALPPSAGAINQSCSSCHQDAMASMAATGHGLGGGEMSGKISCAACHDVHATHRPHLDKGTLEACNACHPQEREQFVGSVHEQLLAGGEMTCLSCHTTHQVLDKADEGGFGCGNCHAKVEADYRKSAHRLARLHGDKIAATCGDCHNGHHVVPVTDLTSPVHPCQEPNTCGKCHGNESVITADYVRLPISLPRYIASIHGINWRVCMPTAVCSDCHGAHALITGSNPESTIHKTNLAVTCGRCHEKVAGEYADSVHGRAVAHGIGDSPSCTDCHDEHLIQPHTDPASPSHHERLAQAICAKCHENPEMAARFGLPPEIIESYEDSYHGWATQRGGKAVAVCTDCHNTHSIGSALDPQSAIHKNNVVQTCARCHPNANPAFAASYTHVFARGQMMAHDWVRLVYIWLLVLVLGGMAIHNLVILLFDLRRHRRRQLGEPAIRRLTGGEVVQHAVLLVTFSGLALSGFALRFPGAFWVSWMTELGFNEELRRLFHRAMAILLVAGSFWHLVYLLFTRRGRTLGRAMVPRLADLKDALATMAYHLRLAPNRPTYGVFDYTQKAEYWALIWGTIVMSITGLVLWFPEFATTFMPAWTVRVSETIHFYEAILAVSAIIIWHFFFVIFKPGTYPMSWIWIDGRMPLDEWRHHHGRAEAELGAPAEGLPPVHRGDA